MTSPYPSDDKSNQRSFDLEVAFLAVTWMVAAFFLYVGFSLTLWRDDTIGPGAFPALVLFLLMVVTSVLLYERLTRREIRILSPFQEGLKDDVSVRNLATKLSADSKIPYRVSTNSGEGRFSSASIGSRLIRGTNALTIVTSETTSLANFRAAVFCEKRFEPVAGLFFDPDVLIVANGSELRNTTELFCKPGLRIGFNHHEDVDYGIDSVLAHKHQCRFESVRETDIDTLVRSVEKLSIDGAVVSLSEANKYIASEQVRGLALFTGSVRLPEPVQPSISGIAASEIVSGRWSAVMVPAGTTTERKDELSLAIESAMLGIDSAEDEVKRAGLSPFLSQAEVESLLKTQVHDFRAVNPGKLDPEMPYGKVVALFVAIAGVAIFPALMSQIGYPIAAFLFLSVLMLLLWPRLTMLKIGVSVGAALVLSLGSSLVFSRVFNVVFPEGLFLNGVWP